MTTPEQIKQNLPHTWSTLFAHHGNFTDIQRQAIPVILSGQNTLLIAATAAGKTEAAIAPLLERHILSRDGKRRTRAQLRILYICPTRALVRDLYERARAPLESLSVSLAMKSGDTAAVSIKNPPTVLITTPESTDSLLTRAPRLLASLQAIILDEIHLFDNSPRGDHLRCLLARIAHIRSYRQRELGQPVVPLQRIALSATVPDPEGIGHRYLTAMANEDATDTKDTLQIVQVAGARVIDAEIIPMLGLSDLVAALNARAAGEPAIRKSLIFCNTRNEVEQVAAYLRKRLPFAAGIFVHYSNLDTAMRRQVETDFAEAAVAICVATTTLELGIDIGSIDDVVLVGPPPTITSFLQRIGRGGRRSGVTRVLCLPRSPLEHVRFEALLDIAESGELSLSYAENPSMSATASSPATCYLPLATAYTFRPSVLVQQTFSILKQSPTGAMRLADLRRIAPKEFDDEILRQILVNLAAEKYLQGGRPGEWRPGPALDELLDAHEIYANIGADPLAVQIVDAYTGRTIAQTDKFKLEGETLLMGGQTMEVVWRDRYRIGVRRIAGEEAKEQLRFQTAPFAVPLEVSQAVAAHVGLLPGELCIVRGGNGAWLFHFWGDVYGETTRGTLGLPFCA